MGLRTLGWLSVLVLAHLSFARPAHATKEIIRTQHNGFEMQIEADDTCVCNPESLGVGWGDAPACAGLCDETGARSPDLVLDAVSVADPNSPIFVKVVVAAHPFDPHRPFEVQGRQAVESFAAGLGVPAPSPEDLIFGHTGELPFVRLELLEVHYYFLFGAESFALIAVGGLDPSSSAADELASELAYSVRMPPPPAQQETADSFYQMGRVIGGLLVLFILWFGFRGLARLGRRLGREPD